jgi:hypothetical protein
LDIVRKIVVSQEKDIPLKWTKNGIFSVKSMYNHLCRNETNRSFTHLWKSNIPLKIKIWLWLIWHNAIATKDNFLKRNWAGSASCQFGHKNETISHLFFDCAAPKFVWSTVAMAIGAFDRPGSFTQIFWWFPHLVPASRNLQIVGLAAIWWAIWKLRNRACFENKLIKSSNELISFTVIFINYWAALHNPSENIRAGAASLLLLASGATATPPPSERQSRGFLRLTDATMTDHAEDDMETNGGDGA